MREVQLLGKAFLGSFTVSVGLLLIWTNLIAPAIPNYKNRSQDDKIFLQNSAVSLYPALTAPFLALSALVALEPDQFQNQNFLVQTPSPIALRAVGLSCGYMFYDTIFCLLHKQCRQPLIIGHHVLSIIFFPYAMLSHRSAVIVLFFIVTEVTFLT